jgi:signal transduction histidine kinase
MTALECGWGAAKFLIFSDNVFAPLIYYSHIGPAAVSILIGLVVLFNNPRDLTNRVLFAITLFFSVWVYFDLILWASEKIPYIMFFWSAIVPVELLIYASCLYLVYLFAHGQKDAPLRTKLIAAAFFVPIVLLAHTSYNLLGFDFSNCDREAIEGPLIQYLYVVELIFIGWAVVLAARGYRRLRLVRERRQMLYVAIGTVLLMTLFTAGNFVVTYFLDLDWSVEQYKLFGMPIFVALVAYSIVRYKTFNVKLIGAQAITAGLAISVASLLVLRTIENVRVVAGITAVFVIIAGYVLVRSVQREIEQRERIEKLAKDLEAANARLKELDKMKSEFLSIASHQLRAPITSVRGYAANLVDGSYGKVPEGMMQPLHVIQESARLMVNSIEDYLNISRIEQGRMKYEKSDFDLGKLARQVVEELQPVAAAKKLALTYAGAGKADVNADMGKVKQVITNLIDNAIKYTPEGKIEVSVEAKGGKAVFMTKDTGIGVEADEIGKLFSKFTRARGANDVNTSGTGLGLYVAKQLTEGNGGTIRVESDGEGKGSRFIVELPVKA